MPRPQIRPGDRQPQPLFAFAPCRLGVLPLGHVLEIAHHPVLPVRQGDTLRLPFKGLLHADVLPPLGKARRDVALSGSQRVPKDARDLRPDLWSPHDPQRFIEIAPNQRLRQREVRQRLRVHLRHAELRIHNIHAARRLLDDLGKKGRVRAQRRIGLLALSDVHHHRAKANDLAMLVACRIPAFIPGAGDARLARRLASELVIEHRLASRKNSRRHLTHGWFQRGNDLCHGLAQMRRYGVAVHFGELIVDAHIPQIAVEEHKTKRRAREQRIELPQDLHLCLLVLQI